ncbi:16S rRNA (guanine(527)-N(7))-methyltransferase RsmG [Mycoplasma sp. NEAQ87857]|uniref:16S rRNA (guanine(527)-N(7))-methyltransferase RsmG n=1 Tax=Mycoplasma sp. NEAQ87857 TaxID=2683967 RepID=UPI00131608A4|nr:16S rRNA (guanine(527)-N(7))-methyltransferase RsmG [Mycoplasma sp. NEAQ87857]QGZ97418.1 16S rRNA (guanine(527)-N(7))-methyltransferase RsmG [Mycoplasma sp. NEAQ87857]
MTSKEIVKKKCIDNNWDFSLFEQYVNMIEEKNKVMNLTGFSGERLWTEGILESLDFMLEITKDLENGTILDIGAGAGFPSIPYILTKPSNKVVIYEPIQKRVNFLNEVISELNLGNYIQVFKQRVEEVKDKNIFDIATARAVASVRSLLMAAFHVVKVKGKMILLKSNLVDQELKDASDVIKQLSVDINYYKFDIPNLDRTNYILEITKKRSTPKQFPYSWKEIKAKSK